jgi:hypothetical protein
MEIDKMPTVTARQRKAKRRRAGLQKNATEILREIVRIDNERLAWVVDGVEPAASTVIRDIYRRRLAAIDKGRLLLKEKP